MKRLAAFAVFLAATALVSSGCTQGKGTTKSGDKKLTVTVKEAHTVKQGATDDVTVHVNRDGFDEDVTVTFDKLPTGVTVQNSDQKVKKGDNTATYTLKAADDAKVGDDQVVHLKASGGGASAETDLKLSVKAK